MTMIIYREISHSVIIQKLSESDTKACSEFINESFAYNSILLFHDDMYIILPRPIWKESIHVTRYGFVHCKSGLVRRLWASAHARRHLESESRINNKTLKRHYSIYDINQKHHRAHVSNQDELYVYQGKGKGSCLTSRYLYNIHPSLHFNRRG